MAEITVKHLGLKISIEGNSSRISEQDLYTQAVVALINKARIKEWQSCYEEEDYESIYDCPDVLDEFCSAVLIAVAHLYRREDTFTQEKEARSEKLGIPENDSMYGVLLRIIDNLGNVSGMMLGGDIIAEEPRDLN